MFLVIIALKICWGIDLIIVQVHLLLTVQK